MPAASNESTFYREWLTLDKNLFRILYLVSESGTYTGSLRDMCSVFEMSNQTKNRTSIANAIDKLTADGFIESKEVAGTYTLTAIPKGDVINGFTSDVETIKAHGYKESIAWENVLKTYVWLRGEKGPRPDYYLMREVGWQSNISADTASTATSILKDLGMAAKNIIKEKCVTIKGEEVVQTLGTDLSAAAWAV